MTNTLVKYDQDAEDKRLAQQEALKAQETVGNKSKLQADFATVVTNFLKDSKGHFLDDYKGVTELLTKLASQANTPEEKAKLAAIWKHQQENFILSVMKAAEVCIPAHIEKLKKELAAVKLAEEAITKIEKEKSPKTEIVKVVNGNDQIVPPKKIIDAEIEEDIPKLKEKSTEYDAEVVTAKDDGKNVLPPGPVVPPLLPPANTGPDVNVVPPKGPDLPPTPPPHPVGPDVIPTPPPAGPDLPPPLNPDPIDTGVSKIKNLEKVELVVIDIEEKLKRIAERLADERLDQEMKEVGPQGWKQLWRLDKIAVKWWKRNANEGYRKKYTDEILIKLRTEPKYRAELMDLNAPGEVGARTEVKPGYRAKLSGSTPQTGPQFNLNNELDAIAERFGIAWSERGAAGAGYLTSNETLSESDATIEVQAAVKDLCEAYVNNRIDEDVFRAQVKERVLPLIAAAGPANQELVAFLQEKSGQNIPLEQRRGLLDKLNAHKAGLIRLDLDNFRLSLAMGKAKNVDVKTEVKDLGTVDRVSRRFVEAIQKNKFLGRFLSPTTIGVMGYGLANIGAQIATSNTVRIAALLSLGAMSPSIAPAVVGVAAGCLIGATMGYFRKNKETLHLKAQKERRSALNHVPEDDLKGLRDRGDSFERRMENGNMLYEKKNVNELMANIDNANSPAAMSAALADAICRNETSELGLSATNKTRMDLISFNGEKSLEKQRLDLMIAIARGRVKFARICTTVGVDANDLLSNDVTRISDEIENGINTKDASFKKFKRWENIKSAGIGAAIGATFSGLSAGISSYFSHTPDVTSHINAGKFQNPADLMADLKARGIADADLKSHLQFDASGKLNSTSIAWLHDNHHIDISQTATGISSVSEVDGTPFLIYQDRTQLLDALKGRGVDTAHLHFGADGKLDQASLDWLKTTHHFGVKQDIVNGFVSTPSMVTMAVNQDKTQLLGILQGRGVDTSHLNFNTDGTLDKASMDYLHNLKIDIKQDLTSVTTPGGGSLNTASLNADGFHTLKGVHFNANDPTGRVHTLDELRYFWKGKPELGTDGNYHFHTKGVLDPSLAHSKLPAGISTPGTPGEMQVALQVDNNGSHYWKIFKPDSSGEIRIPKEYFGDQVGVVARGGSVLPGLKTNALAFGFQDKNGTFQILSSVRGQGNYVPGPTISNAVKFAVDVEDINSSAVSTLKYSLTSLPTTTASTVYDVAIPKLIPGETSGFILPPIYMDKMKHLEYGAVKPGKEVKPGPGEIVNPPPTYYSGKEMGGLLEEFSSKKLEFKPYKKITVKNPENGAFETTYFDQEGKLVSRSVENEKKALHKYLTELPVDDINDLQLLQKQIPPMKENCRVSVNIPAYMEEANIYNLLELYKNQVGMDGKTPLNADTWEMNVIVNREVGTTPDNTANEVLRFKQDNPSLNVNVIDIGFPKGKGGVGAARKLITDLTLLRSVSRSKQVGNLYIQSEDADHVYVDPKTVSNVINRLDTNAHLDAVRGIQDRDPAQMMQNDQFFLTRRAWDIEEILLRDYKLRPDRNPKANFTWNRTITGGWNTAYSAEAYAAIGGYDPKMKMGEDMYIGQKVSVLRGNYDAKNIFIPETTTVSTVPSRIESGLRRFLNAYVIGKNPYDNFGDAEMEKQVRAKKTADLFKEIESSSEISMANVGKLDGNLSIVLTHLTENTPDLKTRNRLFDRLMFSLGFKVGEYTVSDKNEVKIVKIDSVKKALDAYKANPKYKNKRK